MIPLQNCSFILSVKKHHFTVQMRSDALSVFEKQQDRNLSNDALVRFAVFIDWFEGAKRGPKNENFHILAVSSPETASGAVVIKT